MSKKEFEAEDMGEDLNLDAEEPISLDIDDDDIIDDSTEDKKEDVGIQIKTRNKSDKESSGEDIKKEEVKEPVNESTDEPSDVDETQALIDELKEEEPAQEKVEESIEEKNAENDIDVKTSIFALRTTANREDQVVDFLTSNAEKKGFAVYAIIRPHGMRGYVFVEAESRDDVEQAIQGVPYARGLLPSEIEYKEIEHMLAQVKKDVNIKQNDIVEIISGPFKRENAKIIRVDKSKEDVVVELLEAAVPIPITLKMDAVKVIRRENEETEE